MSLPENNFKNSPLNQHSKLDGMQFFSFISLKCVSCVQSNRAKSSSWGMGASNLVHMMMMFKCFLFRMSRNLNFIYLVFRRHHKIKLFSPHLRPTSSPFLWSLNIWRCQIASIILFIGIINIINCICLKKKSRKKP